MSSLTYSHRLTHSLSHEAEIKKRNIRLDPFRQFTSPTYLPEDDKNPEKSGGNRNDGTLPWIAKAETYKTHQPNRRSTSYHRGGKIPMHKIQNMHGYLGHTNWKTLVSYLVIGVKLIRESPHRHVRHASRFLFLTHVALMPLICLFLFRSFFWFIL